MPLTRENAGGKSHILQEEKMLSEDLIVYIILGLFTLPVFILR